MRPSPYTPSSPCPPTKPDTLRWTIFLALLGSASVHAQGGLQAKLDSGGSPIINHQHGVPVINIVAPDANGLSHNKFIDYNVGKQGVVLNNALQGGGSQLAGKLTANPQFQGQAASTILNEVVSRNASLIEGTQEIFGQRANYILANPNGITLNGGRFINTAVAGFVVGKPGFQRGKLQTFETLNANGRLEVKGEGQTNTEGALHLISPRLDSTGLLAAKDTLNITVGRNLIDKHNGKIIRHEPGAPSNIDANLLGAMYAGRINIRSTAEGAGVRMGPIRVEAHHGIRIDSAGALEVSGEPDSSSTLTTKQGELRLKAAADLTLRAVDGNAERISVASGKQLKLDIATGKNEAHHDDLLQKRFTTVYQPRGTQLHSSGDISLKAQGDMALQSATLQAQQGLHLESNGNIDVSAGIGETNTRSYQRESSKQSWRDAAYTSDTQQKAHASTLSANDLKIKSASAVDIKSSNLASTGHLQLEARNISLTGQKLEGDVQHWQTSDRHVSKAPANKHEQSWRYTGTQVKAATLNAQGEQITIRGSEVSSQGNAKLHSTNGSLVVEAGSAGERTITSEPMSKLLGVKASHSLDQRPQLSKIKSSGNLNLSSVDEVRILGARVEAAAHLNVHANKTLVIDSALARKDVSTLGVQHTFIGGMRETQPVQDGKPRSHQWEVFGGHRVPLTITKTTHYSQHASEIEGASINLASGTLLKVRGAKIDAHAGDLNLQGKAISLSSAHDTRSVSSYLDEIGSGAALSIGVERIGFMHESLKSTETSKSEDSKVQRSELLAAVNVTIDSQDDLVNEASRIYAGKHLKIHAGKIDNRAVSNELKLAADSNHWRASLGASLEYHGLTKPFVEIVDGSPADRFQQDSLVDAFTPPSVGIDATLRSRDRQENWTKEYAQVGQLSGASVEVKAAVIDDQGTIWQARTAPLEINAKQHNMLAAHDTSVHTVHNLSADIDTRVDTTTGKDVGVRLNGKGGTLDTVEDTSKAVVGSLQGRGINIRLSGDGVYQGSQINAGTGGVHILSGGSLSVLQASSLRGKESGSLNAKARLKVSSKPGEKGAEFRGYFDTADSSSSKSVAKVASIKADCEVLLNSAGDLLLEGTQIGSEAAKVGDINLHSGGNLQISSARNTHKAQSNRLDGGLEVSAKQGDTKGGGVGGHLGYGNVDEDDIEAVDSHLHSNGQLTLSSRANNERALHLQGVQASARLIQLQAWNGGALIESSANQTKHNNLDITGGVGGLNQQGKTATEGLWLRGKLDLDLRDNQTWNASTFTARTIALDSKGDTRLQGTSLKADHIQGTIGGDLQVESRKDNVDTWIADVDIEASHEKNPQGWANSVNSIAGPWGQEAKQQLKFLTKHKPQNYSAPNIYVLREKRDNVAHQAGFEGAQGIDLKVGGAINLVGARLASAHGDVVHGAEKVTTETLTGNNYRVDGGIKFSTSLVEEALALVKQSKEKSTAGNPNAFNLYGLAQGSYLNQDQELVSSIQGQAK
ncbi:hemagglutinin repeat-containing protein [Pseudomonas urmiensis]|uniref:hemagglutinin repeat-containing protein n=1 Tax=Pseudomonas urmiensis TaxID=2745493 RepID=UPI003D0BC471